MADKGLHLTDDDLQTMMDAFTVALESLTDVTRSLPTSPAAQMYQEIGALSDKVRNYGETIGFERKRGRNRRKNPHSPHDLPHTKSVVETRAILARIKDRCSPSCPGWGIFNEHDGRPEIQVCDECMSELPRALRLSDDDVSQLAEAQKALREAVARTMHDNPGLEDLALGALALAGVSLKNPSRRRNTVEEDLGINPRGTFTAKGERMYEEIKAGYGSDPRAAEIAARTVYARAADGVPGLIERRGRPPGVPNRGR